MSNRWVVDLGAPTETPPKAEAGHLVPMTPEEEAQLAADQAAGAAAAQQAANAEANASTLQQRATTALGTLEDAYTNWATLTQTQKDGVLKLTVRCVAALIRLYLRKLDTAGV